MTILVTGASGFIGSAIVEEALRGGFDTWAGMRPTSSRRYLRDPRTRFVTLSLGDPLGLAAQLERCKAELGGRGWDYVVHAAGVTKCLDSMEFYRVNTEGTRNLAEGLARAGMTPKRLVFLSSLSVFGPVRERPVRPKAADGRLTYDPILGSDEPRPNTHYARSKLRAERLLLAQRDTPVTILRPTGVYGPRERDYLMMARGVARHVDMAAGMRRQEITFVYVADVARAALQCMAAPRAEGRAYFLSDGQVYDSRRFATLLARQMGVRRLARLTAPLWLLRLACAAGGWASRVTGRPTALNSDKYRILAQRNWQCDIAPAHRDFGYAPQWPLERGVEATVAWYKSEGWL